jgi:DNA-binding MarR family transcriptional regulator
VHDGPVPVPASEPAGESPAHESVERELTRLLRRARVALGSYAARIHPEVDLAAYTLLLAVRDGVAEGGGGPVRAADLATRLGLHKSTLSRGLAQLETLGLVERQQDPTDARARLVALSADGARRLNQVTSERRARLSAVLDRWDEADLAALARLLDRLNSDLE